MLNIEKMKEGDALIVKLEGRLDTFTSPTLLEDVEPLLDSVSKLTLDFGQVDYISSAGLRVLLTFEQEMEEQNKPIEISSINEVIRDVFAVTGFLDLLTIS